MRQAEALDENRIVHFKKGKQLGQGYYIVEISSNSTSLFIAAYDVESSESFLITLPEKRAADLMKEFQQSYEMMAESLQVMNKRLYLLNPKYVQQQKGIDLHTSMPESPEKAPDGEGEEEQSPEMLGE